MGLDPRISLSQFTRDSREIASTMKLVLLKLDYTASRKYGTPRKVRTDELSRMKLERSKCRNRTRRNFFYEARPFTRARDSASGCFAYGKIRSGLHFTERRLLNDVRIKIYICSGRFVTKLLAASSLFCDQRIF